MGWKEKNEEGKTFSSIGNNKLFYLLYRKRVLLSVRYRANKNPGADKGVNERHECNAFTLGE